VLVPDATRSCPLPVSLKAVHGALHGRCNPPDGGRRARYARKDDRRGAGRSTSAMSLEWPRSLPVDDGSQSPMVGRFCSKWLSAPSLPTGCGTVWRAAEQGRSDVQVNRRRHRNTTSPSSSGPVFPHEVVGFSGATSTSFQVCRGSEFHRPVRTGWAPLISEHRDHRHARYHTGTRAHRRGGVDDPGANAWHSAS